MKPSHHNSLKRLAPAFYRGKAFVHWSLTIEDRKTGWLVPIFYYKFREILTHSAFRFGLCCPIYRCMADHIHLLWAGILETCDQRRAMRYFRLQLNPILERLNARFQLQPYDHVLTEEERERDAFEIVADYIARNPERRGLVAAGCYANYPYTGCLLPGYPEVKLFEGNYWDKFWRIYSHLAENGFHAGDRAAADSASN
jgi:hypothetical protein